MKRARQKCEREKVAKFDYSKLSADFAKLSKPAQRALIHQGILSASDLAQKTEREIAALHGMGPSSMPVLRAALRNRGLKFLASAPPRLSRSPKRTRR